MCILNTHFVEILHVHTYMGFIHILSVFLYIKFFLRLFIHIHIYILVVFIYMYVWSEFIHFIHLCTLFYLLSGIYYELPEDQLVHTVWYLWVYNAIIHLHFQQNAFYPFMSTWFIYGLNSFTRLSMKYNVPRPKCYTVTHIRRWFCGVISAEHRALIIK